MQQKILILGGANLHCKLVKAAKEMGLYTVVTDYLEASPAKLMADEAWMLDVKATDEIVARCKKEGITAVISTHLDPCQRPYQEICEKLGVPCYIGSFDQVFALTNKDAFKDACVKNGVDIIPTYTEDADDIDYPVLVKPVQSRGSRGQTICENAQELPAALALAKKESDNGCAIIEKYMGNKNDFTMTYIFANGVPHMTKTSDRYLGPLELGFEKVGIGTISPSYFTDMYIKNVEPRLLGMLKDLGIQNGPVFMQGFVDGDTVRFYDPGYRFPGSEYDTMFESIWGIDLMKMMVEFALTGEMKTTYGMLRPDLYTLKGHAVVTLFPVVREGTITAVEGLDAISSMPQTVCYTLRHQVGEYVPLSKDVNQRIAEFDLVGEDLADLKNAIVTVLDTLKVFDENGDNMLAGNLTAADIMG